jgi:hypothetical protein
MGIPEKLVSQKITWGLLFMVSEIIPIFLPGSESIGEP